MAELPMDCPVLIAGHEMDEGAELFRGWNIEVIQLGHGAMHGSGVVVPLGHVRITGIHFGVAAILRGTSLKGYSSLIWTPPTSPSVRVGSRRIGDDTCLMLGSQAPMEIYLPENCSVFILSVLAATLTERTTSHAIEHPPVRRCAEVRALTSDHSALLNRYMDLVESFRRADSSDLVASQVQRRPHELLLPATASLFMQSTALPSESGAKKIRRRAVSRARAYIDVHLREPITLENLCDTAGVRARTLEYGFREFYDVGPMAYIRSVRLSRVRRDLLSVKSPNVSIAETARRYRFTHMGQFGRDYRILFGESPSTTLARRRAISLRQCGLSASREE